MPGATADSEPLWLELPSELAGFFKLGFVHTDEQCPLFVLRMLDRNGAKVAEVAGAPEAYLELIDAMTRLCNAAPCLSHDRANESSQRAAS